MFGLKKTGMIVLFKCVITERSHEIQGDGAQISQDLAVSYSVMPDACEISQDRGWQCPGVGRREHEIHTIWCPC